MKIVIIPLDERPCNYDYLLDLPLPDEVNLILPPREILSKKKEVCDISKLHDWLLKNVVGADYLVVSFDTLLYGGIIPSRLHHQNIDELKEKSSIIKKVKEINPKIKIFANSLIMRCPSYNYSDEEPSYFSHSGYAIFRYGQLTDKAFQKIITESEQKELEQLKTTLNPEYLEDFTSRRKKNLDVLISNLSYLKDGTIDFFIIPQDDCSEYGFTSIDQRIVKKFINDEDLEDKAVIYPGADEVGLTLVGRVLNDFYKKRLKFYVFYSSVLGRSSIPMFEDRPISETIKYHIFSVKGILVSSISEADICLGVNLGSEFLDKHDERCSIVYGKNRNLPSFIDTISYILSENKIVGVADVAFCNEADKELIHYLKKNDLLYKIHAYAGWNTSSNTLGTTISNLISYYYSKNEEKKNESLTYRYLDDYLYMGVVRDEIIDKIKKDSISDVTKFDLGREKDRYESICSNLLISNYKNFVPSLANNVKNISCDFVWNRTFEVLIKYTK